MEVKRTERGWPGHYCAASMCLFRRNTLVEYGDNRYVVSTVGNYRLNNNIEMIGLDRYYETMVFEAIQNGSYWDANVSKQININSDWGIWADSPFGLPHDVDNVADEIHEAVVNEVMSRKDLFPS